MHLAKTFPIKVLEVKLESKGIFYFYSFYTEEENVVIKEMTGP